MIWVMGTGLVLLLVFILFLLTKVHISLHYQHSRDDDRLTVKARAWGLPIYKLEVPEIALDEESPSLVFKEKTRAAKMKEHESKKKLSTDDLLSKFEAFRHLLERVVGLQRITRRFLSHVTIGDFQWHTKLGLEDAAATGMAVGGAWMIKGNIVGILDHYMRLQQPVQYEVEPVYEGLFSQTHLQCMISFRLGHAMGAAFQIVRFWKGRPHHRRQRHSRLASHE